MAIKQHLQKNALNLQSIQEKFLPIIFPAIRSTKHFCRPGVGQLQWLLYARIQ